MPLESRRLLSTSVAITGSVVDAYRLPDNTVAHVGLADRTVYVDVNNDGKLESGEASTVTDLKGNYKLTTLTGNRTVRLVELSGWSAAGLDSTSLSISSGTASVSAGTFSTRMTHPYRIDVLALYTSASKAGKDSHAIAAQIRSLFLQANQVYANSDTNVILNLTAMSATTYRESGDIDKDLDAVTDGTGGLSSVAALRKTNHADLVTMFTSGAKTPGDSIGVAWEFDPRSPKDTSNGFSVVALQNDSDDNDAFTLAHEIGHNLGAGHDKPDNDGAGVTAYAYGYHYRGIDGKLYQDVMDYSDGTILPFFSTPDFSWAGKPVGNAATADNARIIQLEAPKVEAYA